jgi:oligopeptide/dipeptide ABC transporter ATP-binding protein
MNPLLRVQDMCIDFHTADGVVRAVDRVSLDVKAGQMLGIVGESGSGKSALWLGALGLLPHNGRVSEGRAEYLGSNLLELPERAKARLRGKEIAMIFQDPLTALNPIRRIGKQIAETIRVHEGVAEAEARSRTLGVLKEVGIRNPERVAGQYPHELSGGMCQRVMIGMAIACRPKLLVADEPSTALDVTIQAQIINLLLHLKISLDMAIVLITHDLGVVAAAADEVAVMYSGRLVERADTKALFTRPSHPYTAALLQALPRTGARDTRLGSIPGQIPGAFDRLAGCRFAPRCSHAVPRCSVEEPPLRREDDGRFSLCHLPAFAGVMEAKP